MWKNQTCDDIVSWQHGLSKVGQNFLERARIEVLFGNTRKLMAFPFLELLKFSQTCY